MTIDKLPNGWTRVKFGDVVRNCNENSRDLEADGIERVVGLDHLDPGSLRLVRWDELAELSDGTTFTRKFRPRQVLFGKRRAYQRKVAVPDFAGVCSGDILVFEPADERMLTDFLPYVVQSEGFFDHALGTSAGSLSPRTKWAELAKYEFALPPIDEQQRIVGLLSAMARHLAGVKRSLLDARGLVSAVVFDHVWQSASPRSPLSEAWPEAHFFDGDWIESKDQSTDGVRLLQLGDIGQSRFLDKSSRFVSAETFERLKCSEVLPGDFLISRMADPIGRTCVVPDLGVRLITVVDACVVRVPSMSPEERAYWLALLNSSQWTRSCVSASGGTTRTRVSRSKLERLAVPNLSAGQREEVGESLLSASALVESLVHLEQESRLLLTRVRETSLRGESNVH